MVEAHRLFSSLLQVTRGMPECNVYLVFQALQCKVQSHITPNQVLEMVIKNFIPPGPYLRLKNLSLYLLTISGFSSRISVILSPEQLICTTEHNLGPLLLTGVTKMCYYFHQQAPRVNERRTRPPSFAPFPFLQLPTDVYLQIHALHFESADACHYISCTVRCAALLRVNHQTYAKGSAIALQLLMGVLYS